MAFELFHCGVECCFQKVKTSGAGVILQVVKTSVIAMVSEIRHESKTSTVNVCKQFTLQGTQFVRV